MKKIIAFLMTLTLCAGATACGETNPDNDQVNSSEETSAQSEEETEKETTAEEALDYAERLLYNALIKLSPSLKNPSSIRVAELAGPTYFVRITGENSFGGASSAWFKMDTSSETLTETDYSDSAVLEAAINSNTAPNLDLNAINRAIAEYFG